MYKYKARENRRIPTRSETMTIEIDKMDAITIRIDMEATAKRATITINIVRSNTSHEMITKIEKTTIMRDSRDHLLITSIDSTMMTKRSSSMIKMQTTSKRILQQL